MTRNLEPPGQIRTGPTSPHGASVRVVGLVKEYGSVRAVDGVDLDVRRGELLALLGPSGSGKTTILMTIAGFETPSAGRIVVDDNDITHVRPEKRRIGMVFQSYALFPHLRRLQGDVPADRRRLRLPPGEGAADWIRTLGIGSVSCPS